MKLIKKKEKNSVAKIKDFPEKRLLEWKITLQESSRTLYKRKWREKYEMKRHGRSKKKNQHTFNRHTRGRKIREYEGVNI